MNALRVFSLLPLTTLLACADGSFTGGQSTSSGASEASTGENASTADSPDTAVTDEPSTATRGSSGPSSDPNDDADPMDDDSGLDTSGDGSDTDPSGESDSGSDDSESDGDPPMGEPVTVAVGYGGIRIRSLDDGQTWQDYHQLASSGGDDIALLRGAAWGAGRFVAVGWRIFSSADGATWTEHDNPSPIDTWYGAVAYGNEQFLAAGGGGFCTRSSDGQAWEVCTDITDDAGFTHVRSVLFLDGLFYAADANGVLRSSPDGTVWSVEDNVGTPWIAIADGAIVTREQNAPAEFATKRLRGNGSLVQRAEPGTGDWDTVYTVPNNNHVFQAFRFAFAEGWVQ